MRGFCLSLAAAALAGTTPAVGRAQASDPHAGHHAGMASMPGMDHGMAMPMPAPKTPVPESSSSAAAEAPAPAADKTRDPPEVSDDDASPTPVSNPGGHGAHAVGGPGARPGMTMDMQMDMSGMQGGSPPPDARDPDYSDGRRASHAAEHAHTPGNDAQWGVNFERAEATLAAGRLGGTWDGEYWYGTDRRRGVLASEGEAGPDGVSDARTELRLRVPYAPFWNVEAGGRVDAADGAPARGWASLGVSGIAPYWFHNEAFVYVGERGNTALRLEARYDFRLNQKTVLSPRAEANLYGQADPALRRGAGLSSGELGLRLRYEIVPWVAPYVGVETQWLYRGTARQAADEGRNRVETKGVLGARFWF